MIKAISAYLRKKLPLSFVNWTDEALEDYVMFHMEQNTLKCVCNLMTMEISAVLVGWQQDSVEMVNFNWQKTDPNGRYWYWDQFAANSPNDAMVVAATFFLTHPQSAFMPSVGMRNGSMKLYKNVMSVYKKAKK